MQTNRGQDHGGHAEPDEWHSSNRRTKQGDCPGQIRQQTLLGIRKRCKGPRICTLSLWDSESSVAGSPPHWRITSKWNTISGSSALLTNMSNHRITNRRQQIAAKGKGHLSIDHILDPKQHRLTAANSRWLCTNSREHHNILVARHEKERWQKGEKLRLWLGDGLGSVSVSVYIYVFVSMEFFTLQFIHEQLATVSGGFWEWDEPRKDPVRRRTKCNSGGNSCCQYEYLNFWIWFLGLA